MSLEMGSLSRLVPSLAASEQSWMGWDGMGWERRLVEFLFFPSNAVAPNYHAAHQRCTGEISKRELEIGSDRGYLCLAAGKERVESSRTLRPGNGICPCVELGRLGNERKVRFVRLAVTRQKIAGCFSSLRCLLLKRLSLGAD